MKEYFFLNGKDQNGPFTIEQLHSQNITGQTMVWADGMGNWQKLRDIPELAQEFGIKTPHRPQNQKMINLPKMRRLSNLK